MTKKKQRSETPLTIARMIIRNYLIIQEMSMEFGKFNKITAANRRGKTSILKAIREAFKSSGIDPSLIHDDENEAEIIVELTDGVNIERKITPDKNNVKVTVDDQRVTAPTVFLRELLGSGGQLSFDPTQYFLAGEEEKRRLLLSALPITVTEKELAKLAADKGFDIVWKLIKLIDIDFDQHGLTVLDKIGKLIYERRAEQNVHVTRLTKALEQDRRELPETVDAEQYKGFKLDGAMELLQTMERQVKEHDGNIILCDELQEEIEGTGVEIKEQADFIESLKNQIAGAEQAIIDLRALKQNKQRAHKAITKKVNAFDAPDVDGQREYIQGFEASQAAVIKLEEIERRETKLGDDKKLHYMLDEFYKYFNSGIVKEMIGRADLPIEGISLNDKGGILIHGRPLNRLSDSEQISFAVDIAEVLVGRLGVILVDGLEAMDEDSLMDFEARALKSPCQFITCKVGTGDLRLERE